MKFTEENLAKLRAAYSSGVLKIRFGDKEIIYRSEAELRKTIARVEKELGLSQKVRLPRSTSRKGL